jgi:hypothetical protein
LGLIQAIQVDDKALEVALAPELDAMTAVAQDMQLHIVDPDTVNEQFLRRIVQK